MAAVLAAVVTAGVMWFLMRGGTPQQATPVSAPTAAGGEATGTGTRDPQESESGEPSEAPQDAGGGTTAKGQAQAVDDLLSDSGGARSGLGPALVQVRQCEETTSAISTIERVTEARRKQVEQVRTLELGAVTDGATIKNRLTTALQASLDADESFLTWARRRANDCDADWTKDPDYNAGLSSSTKATAAKQEFIQLWNPVAEDHGLPDRAAHEI
ncbi:hypothetical protein DP939_39190 [Spongiactinospora rosea]|uniref:Uncharacterized protein n=1 Tax=Spongiactinospora rosea TaxID=2248750 RepID=A0A366LLK2_9ACTN|nr:hypothetical protein [Spongiactinospora rosea]RBQ14798.1 hypothetical protein DP939_39190 [Spongiactinospora rosea]